MGKAELDSLEKSAEQAVCAIEELIANGVDSAMNKYN